MKFNGQTMATATGKMLEDSFWLKVYDGAPPGAKKRLRVAFWSAKYHDENEDLDEYRLFRERVEREMTYDDADYLAGKMPSETAREHYRELRDKIQFRGLRTAQKLDAAIDVLLNEYDAAGRKACEQSRLLLRESTDEFVRYEWLWEAIGGNRESCEMLGDVFLHGHGVKVDVELAFYWFHKGALSGSEVCCRRLALLYEDEAEKFFNIERAIFWYREALRRGDFATRYILGRRLAFCDDAYWQPYKNPKFAVALFESCLKDDDDGYANYHMGLCHQQGVGVEKDLAKAYGFFKVAERRGNRFASLRLLEIRKEMAHYGARNENYPTASETERHLVKRKKELKMKNEKQETAGCDFPNVLTAEMLSDFKVTPEGSTHPHEGWIGGVHFIAKCARYSEGETATTDAHVHNEYLADCFLRAVGLNVPESREYHVDFGDGKGPRVVRLARFIENTCPLKRAFDRAQNKGKLYSQVLTAYPVMSYIAATDTFHNDNALVDADGKIWFVDNGASFDYRARGGKKGWWFTRCDVDDSTYGYLALRNFRTAHQLQKMLPISNRDLWLAAMHYYDFYAVAAKLPEELKKGTALTYAAALKDRLRDMCW